METITCRRCGRTDAEPLAKAPFKSELGERILREICHDCWQGWLKQQTQLINHYRLDPRDAEARAFLYAQIEQVLFGDGEAPPIDTSQEGTVSW